MEEAQSSYCCVASAYVVVLPCAAAVVGTSDRCAFIDDVFPRLVRHLYKIIFMCYTLILYTYYNNTTYIDK